MSKEFKIRTILLPADGSDASLKAARYAIKLAKIENARVIAIYAIGIPMYIPEYEGTILIPSYYEVTRKFAAEWLGKILEMAKEENVDLKKEIIVDVVSVVDAIVSYAKNNDVDLVVMGTTGRTGLKKFLLGSVANGVVTHAHCPVLVVR